MPPCQIPVRHNHLVPLHILVEAEPKRTWLLLSYKHWRHPRSKMKRGAGSSHDKKAAKRVLQHYIMTIAVMENATGQATYWS
jgi:hypothetical protein